YSSFLSIVLTRSPRQMFIIWRILFAAYYEKSSSLPIISFLPGKVTAIYCPFAFMPVIMHIPYFLWFAILFLFNGVFFFPAPSFPVSPMSVISSKKRDLDTFLLPRFLV